MHFVKTTNRDKGATALKQRLIDELGSNKHVLWLLSGSSNIASSVEIMKGIPTAQTKNLAIFLVDERFGEVGHLDSNAKQLLDAGFSAQEAIFVPTLMPGFSLEETRERYTEASRRAFEHADVVIGQVGIGADGHIAGILPHSPAVDSQDWVAAYQTETYTRVTLTFEALRKLDVNYAFVFGEEKKPMLQRLRDEELPLEEQPAQLFKELPEAFVFNDQIGDKS